jgi:hypothetical protein
MMMILDCSVAVEKSRMRIKGMCARGREDGKKEHVEL